MYEETVLNCKQIIHEICMEIFENFSRSRLKSNRLRDTAKLVGTGTYVKFSVTGYLYFSFLYFPEAVSCDLFCLMFRSSSNSSSSTFPRVI